MPPSNRAIELSERVFRRLLRAYPSSLRTQYEGPMMQLFRDLCRDARNRRGGVGLIALWGFILKDTVGSLISEYRDEWRRVMNQSMNQFRRSLVLKIRRETSPHGLARGFLWGGAIFVLIGSVLKLTSLRLTEGQLLIGLLCTCAVSIQLTILGVLVPPPPEPESPRRLEG